MIPLIIIAYKMSHEWSPGCLVVIRGHTTQLKDYDDLISLFVRTPHQPIDGMIGLDHFNTKMDVMFSVVMRLCKPQVYLFPYSYWMVDLLHRQLSLNPKSFINSKKSQSCVFFSPVKLIPI